jgi:hypothetical protein
MSPSIMRMSLAVALVLGAVAGQDPTAVDLGTAASFVILTKAGISTAPDSSITGDIGVSPAAATYLTGFSLTADSSGTFSTSGQITGSAWAANYISPTPSKMTTAISDMETAYTAAAASTRVDAAKLDFLGGLIVHETNLEAGVYEWGSSINLSGDITITGGAADIFIFKTTGNIIVSDAASITLVGGALASNIVWQAAGFLQAGYDAHLEGIFLLATNAIFMTGASLTGRVLAQTAVTLDKAIITQP